MDKAQILSEIQEIFRDTLDNEEIVLTNDTTAEDIEEWTSLTHIQLVVAIEKKYGVKFSLKEIMSWTNVGSIVDCIASR